MQSLSPSPFLDMWKDYEPDVGLSRRNATTRSPEPATGLTNLTFRLSLEEQGDPIGALTGIAATEAGTTDHFARYVGAIDLATLTSEMPDSDEFANNVKVYLQLWKSGDIQVEAFQKRIRRRKY